MKGASVFRHIFPLVRVVEQVRTFAPELPAQQLELFLWTVLRPDSSMSELASRAGIKSSSASRAFASLSKWRGHQNDGLNLIEMYEDSQDRRMKRVRLTEKGLRLARLMEDALTDHNKEPTP